MKFIYGIWLLFGLCVGQIYAQCDDPPMKGIFKEEGTIYKLMENDTLATSKDSILETTFTAFYNPNGKLDYVWFVHNNDTSYQYNYYDAQGRLLEEHYYDSFDTTVHISAKWDKNGVRMESVTEDSTERKFYIYKDCRLANIERFHNGKKEMTISHIWENNLMVQTTYTYYGALKQAIGREQSIRELEYIRFNRNGNWLERITRHSSGEVFFERVVLTYYD